MFAVHCQRISIAVINRPSFSTQGNSHRQLCWTTHVPILVSGNSGCRRHMHEEGEEIAGITGDMCLRVSHTFFFRREWFVLRNEYSLSQATANASHFCITCMCNDVCIREGVGIGLNESRDDVIRLQWSPETQLLTWINFLSLGSHNGEVNSSHRKQVTVRPLFARRFSLKHFLIFLFS